MSKRRSVHPEEQVDLEDKLHEIEEEISSQTSALGQMQRAMEELPSQIHEIQQRLDKLAASMGGVPTEIEEKAALLAEVDRISLPEEPPEKTPDWGLEADIRAGRLLRAVVYASFILEDIADPSSEPSDDSNTRLHRILSRDWTSQSTSGMGRRSGRMTIEVHNIEVRKCRIRGAPKDAERTLVLSPDAGIPVVQEDDELSFDFAPVLAIQNTWNGAEIPTFRPMGAEIRVSLEDFQERESFSLRFSLKEQDQRMTVKLRFEPLAEE